MVVSNLTKRTYHSQFILIFAVLLWTTMVLKLIEAEENIKHIRGRRELEDSRIFDVQLYLDLQYIDNSLASEIETLDVNNPYVIHFCRAVQAQVSCIIRRKMVHRINNPYIASV